MEIDTEEQRPLLGGDSDTELYFPVEHTPRVVSKEVHDKSTGWVQSS